MAEIKVSSGKKILIEEGGCNGEKNQLTLIQNPNPNQINPNTDFNQTKKKKNELNPTDVCVREREMCMRERDVYPRMRGEGDCRQLPFSTSPSSFPPSLSLLIRFG